MYCPAGDIDDVDTRPLSRVAGGILADECRGTASVLKNETCIKEHTSANVA